jgi:hypothetical protein
MSYFSANDLVFNKDPNGKIKSGGYLINSILMSEGIAPMTTLNDTQSGGARDQEKVSDIFNNLAVPAGLFCINKKSQLVDCDMEKSIMDQHVPLSDDIHDRLLAMIEYSDNHKPKSTKKQGTRKQIQKIIAKNNKKTTKNTKKTNK